MATVYGISGTLLAQTDLPAGINKVTKIIISEIT
jgi:hypothetical protein